MKTNNDEYLQEFANDIADLIKNNNAPWQKPWKMGESFLPRNFISGRQYSGLNSIRLMSKYPDEPCFLTPSQAHKIGLIVKKGEKANNVVFIKNFEEEVEKNGKIEIIKKTKHIPHKVFNLSQFEGYVPSNKREDIEKNEFKPIEKAQEILDSVDVPIIHKTQDKAFYEYLTDTVTLPQKTQFSSSDEYYRTAFHEVAHSTGHSSRLNRDLSGRFGSKRYAKEEFVAEIASFFIGGHALLGHTPNENTVAYLDSWSKKIKDDPSFLKEVVRLADEACTYTIKNYLDELDKKRALAGQEMVENYQAKIIYLDVPKTEKDEAKALGAHWDNQRKLWFIDTNKVDIDISALKWKIVETDNLDKNENKQMSDTNTNNNNLPIEAHKFELAVTNTNSREVVALLDHEPSKENPVVLSGQRALDFYSSLENVSNTQNKIIDAEFTILDDDYIKNVPTQISLDNVKNRGVAVAFHQDFIKPAYEKIRDAVVDGYNYAKNAFSNIYNYFKNRSIEADYTTPSMWQHKSPIELEDFVTAEYIGKEKAYEIENKTPGLEYAGKHNSIAHQLDTAARYLEHHKDEDLKVNLLPAPDKKHLPALSFNLNNEMIANANDRVEIIYEQMQQSLDSNENRLLPLKTELEAHQYETQKLLANNPEFKEKYEQNFELKERIEITAEKSSTQDEKSHVEIEKEPKKELDEEKEEKKREQPANTANQVENDEKKNNLNDKDFEPTDIWDPAKKKEIDVDDKSNNQEKNNVDKTEKATDDKKTVDEKSHVEIQKEPKKELTPEQKMIEAKLKEMGASMQNLSLVTTSPPVISDVPNSDQQMVAFKAINEKTNELFTIKFYSNSQDRINSMHETVKEVGTPIKVEGITKNTDKNTVLAKSVTLDKERLNDLNKSATETRAKDTSQNKEQNKGKEHGGMTL